jgi:single-strand DNA-binding protein
MFQKILAIGNLGRDPEMRYTPDGKAVTNLSVATNKKWTDANGDLQERVVWLRVSVWGKQAEACNQYLKKGRQVFVEGELIADENGNPRLWDRSDGSKAASFEVRAHQVKFLGGRGDNGQDQKQDDDFIPGFSDLNDDDPYANLGGSDL